MKPNLRVHHTSSQYSRGLRLHHLVRHERRVCIYLHPDPDPIHPDRSAMRITSSAQQGLVTREPLTPDQRSDE